MIAVYQPKRMLPTTFLLLENTALLSSWPLCVSPCLRLFLALPSPCFPVLLGPRAALSPRVLTANSGRIQTPQASGSLHLCPQACTSSPDWSLKFSASDRLRTHPLRVPPGPVPLAPRPAGSALDIHPTLQHPCLSSMPFP